MNIMIYPSEFYGEWSLWINDNFVGGFETKLLAMERLNEIISNKIITERSINELRK